MKIALVSLNQVWEDKKANLYLCKSNIEIAFLQKVDLIIFPEMTLSGFTMNHTLIAEHERNSETLKHFLMLAAQYHIAIVFGVAIKHGDKAYNKSIFINKSGEVLAEYAKIHPFTFAGEDTCFDAGEQLKIVKFDDFKIGLTICYDLRFPELYSALAKESDLVVNIANWPSKRIEHWNVLLKARAIENQIFIVGVNRIGTDNNGLTYSRSSNIVNANGEVLEYESIQDMQIYEIDKTWTKHFKETFNTTKDRKSDFYKGIL